MPIDQESLLYLPDVIRRGRRAQSPASEEPPTLPAAQEDISPPAEPREGWVLPPGYDSHGGIETSYASSWTLALDNCFLDLCCSPDDDCCIRYLTMRGECRRAAEMFSVLLVQSLSFGEAGPTLCRCRYIKEVSCANAETADIWSLHKPKFHRDRVYLCPGGLVITLVRGGNVFTFPTLRSDGSEVPPVTEQALADLAKMPASEQRLLYLDRQAGFTPLWSCDTSVGDRVNLTGGACVLQGSVDVVTARKAYSLEVKAAEAIFAGVLASPEPRLLPPVCFLVTYAGCTLFVEGLVPRHCVDLLAHNRNWIFSGQPSVPEYTTPFEAIMSKGQVALETYDINLHEALEQITRITNARLRIGPSTAYIRSEVVAMIDEREAVRDRMLAYLSSKYGSSMPAVYRHEFVMPSFRSSECLHRASTDLVVLTARSNGLVRVRNLWESCSVMVPSYAASRGQPSLKCLVFRKRFASLQADPSAESDALASHLRALQTLAPQIADETLRVHDDQDLVAVLHAHGLNLRLALPLLLSSKLALPRVYSIMVTRLLVCRGLKHLFFAEVAQGRASRVAQHAQAVALRMINEFLHQATLEDYLQKTLVPEIHHSFGQLVPLPGLREVTAEDLLADATGAVESLSAQLRVQLEPNVVYRKCFAHNYIGGSVSVSPENLTLETTLFGGPELYPPYSTAVLSTFSGPSNSMVVGEQTPNCTRAYHPLVVDTARILEAGRLIGNVVDTGSIPEPLRGFYPETGGALIAACVPTMHRLLAWVHRSLPATQGCPFSRLYPIIPALCNTSVVGQLGRIRSFTRGENFPCHPRCVLDENHLCVESTAAITTLESLVELNSAVKNPSPLFTVKLQATLALLYGHHSRTSEGIALLKRALSSVLPTATTASRFLGDLASLHLSDQDFDAAIRVNTQLRLLNEPAAPRKSQHLLSEYMRQQGAWPEWTLDLSLPLHGSRAVDRLRWKVVLAAELLRSSAARTADAWYRGNPALFYARDLMLCVKAEYRRLLPEIPEIWFGSAIDWLLGSTLSDTGRLGEAETVLREAIGLTEGSGSSRHMRQMLELALCKCLRKSHRCREALVLATEVSQALDKSLGRLNEWSVDAKRLQGVLSSTVASHQFHELQQARGLRSHREKATLVWVEIYFRHLAALMTPTAVFPTSDLLRTPGTAPAAMPSMHIDLYTTGFAIPLPHRDVVRAMLEGRNETTSRVEEAVWGVIQLKALDLDFSFVVDFFVRQTNHTNTKDTAALELLVQPGRSAADVSSLCTEDLIYSEWVFQRSLRPLSGEQAQVLDCELSSLKPPCAFSVADCALKCDPAQWFDIVKARFEDTLMSILRVTMTLESKHAISKEVNRSFQTFTPTEQTYPAVNVIESPPAVSSAIGRRRRFQQESFRGLHAAARGMRGGG